MLKYIIYVKDYKSFLFRKNCEILEFKWMNIMVVVAGNEIGNTSSNPRQGCLHFTLGKRWIYLFSPLIEVNRRENSVT